MLLIWKVADQCDVNFPVMRRGTWSPLRTVGCTSMICGKCCVIVEAHVQKVRLKTKYA